MRLTGHRFPQFLWKRVFVQHDANRMVSEVGHGDVLFAAKIIALSPRVFDDEILPALGIRSAADDVHEVIIRVFL